MEKDLDLFDGEIISVAGNKDYMSEEPFWNGLMSLVECHNSVLLQLLFLVYVNYLPEGMDSCPNMFAGDANIKREVNSEDCIDLKGDLDRLKR